MLATSSGFTDAIADFGDDRRDVYKVYVRAGETLRVRTEGLPLGGNLGLDVAHLLARHARSREPRDARARRARALGLATARCASATTTAKDGFFFVQVTSRRGWGAYRLRWSVDPGPVALEASGAEQLVGRHVAQHARGLADHDRARRHVAQHDRAGADERVLADLDAGQQDRGAADARAAPDRPRPS